MRSSKPPRCSAHRKDRKKRVGAPKANKNAVKHGAYSASRPDPEGPLKTIDDVVLDALAKQTTLSVYIEERLKEADVRPGEMTILLSLHGQNASRLGRLFRDQKYLSGGGTDDLLSFLDSALDLLKDDLGVTL